MFTPEPGKAARELKRVVRDGGRIGMANWTPEGFIGQLFRVIGAYARRRQASNPPCSGAPSRESLSCSARRRPTFAVCGATSTFAFDPPRTGLTLPQIYGPTHKVYAALDATRQVRLTEEITALLERFNVGGANSLVVPSEYQVVITKK